MDIRKVKKLIELLQESALLEMEIREGEESIRLSRAGTAATVAAPVPVMAGPLTHGAPPPAAEPVPTGHAIKAPMVGTYYASSGPDADPFVEIGSKVVAGATLCIIEAMKIFNQIEADRSGTVTAIFRESGDPIEYGELLFLIE